MFSADHFIWLIICVVFISLLIVLERAFKFNFKTATLITVGVSIVSEVMKIMTHMFPYSRWAGDGATLSGYENASYLLPKSLPFHLCSILIFFFFYLALSKNEKNIEKVKTFIVPICLLGGFLALAIGNSLDSENTKNVFDSFKDPSLSPYQTFFYHATILWYGLYLIYTKQVKLGFKEWCWDSVALFALFVFSIWINSFLHNDDVNFMFTVYPPAKKLPFLNLNHGWHVYIVHLLFTGLILTFLVHLPSIITQYKKTKKLYNK